MKRFLYSFLILLTACQNKHHVDLSKIDISYNIIRYDSLLFEAEMNNYPVYFQNLYNDHPEFTKVYCEQLFQLGELSKDSFNLSKELSYLVSNPDFQSIYQNAKQQHLDQGLKDLDLAFHYLKYHFPKIAIPDVYLYLGRFEYASIVGQGFIGVAREMTLGGENDYLKNSGMPRYVTRKLDEQHMPLHTIQNLLMSEFPQRSQDHLLDYMVYNGKLLYALDAIFPEAPDSIKIGYPNGKIEWCHQNENEIWSWLLKHELLYNSQQMEFLKFTMDGPNTAGMPPEAPGNIASWMGWQIVRAYMEAYPNTTLEELMLSPALAKGQNVLNRSAYKPR